MSIVRARSVAAGQAPSRAHPFRRLAATGALASLAAVVATTVAAALVRAVGVDLEVSDAAQGIPLSGIAVVTGFFSLVGVALAAALLRWSAHPAQRFVWITVSLTAISLVPPVLLGADAGATIALVALHLVAAAVMIPSLAGRLTALRG